MVSKCHDKNVNLFQVSAIRVAVALFLVLSFSFYCFSLSVSLFPNEIVHEDSRTAAKTRMVRMLLTEISYKSQSNETMNKTETEVKLIVRVFRKKISIPLSSS